MRSVPQLDRSVEKVERARAPRRGAQPAGTGRRQRRGTWAATWAYRLGAGINHAEPAPHVLPDQWTPLGRLDELPDGKPTRRTLAGAPVFVPRRGRQVDVLYDLCSHQAGPLSEGELSGAGEGVCITCPWHGSTFRLRDGEVRRGPTTYPQPVLRVRVDPDGSVQARLGEDD